MKFPELFQAKADDGTTYHLTSRWVPGGASMGAVRDMTKGNYEFYTRENCRARHDGGKNFTIFDSDQDKEIAVIADF